MGLMDLMLLMDLKRLMDQMGHLVLMDLKHLKAL
jgi:hypothetical protein